MEFTPGEAVKDHVLGLGLYWRAIERLIVSNVDRASILEMGDIGTLKMHGMDRRIKNSFLCLDCGPSKCPESGDISVNNTWSKHKLVSWVDRQRGMIERKFAAKFLSACVPLSRSHR